MFSAKYVLKNLQKEGDNMRIGFIGAGRVGFTMGKYLTMHGAKVSGYYSRTPEHAREAAEFTDTEYFENAEKLIENSDAVILTVSDNAIAQVFDDICDSHLAGKIMCHTSGAMSSGIFEGKSVQVYGYSIHPIYAISDRYESYKNFSNAFITIEGNEKYLNEVRKIFTDAGLNSAVIDSSDKAKYHAASVVASNMVCGLYGTAIRLMTECGFSDEDAKNSLKGLFVDNAIAAAEIGPDRQLTGPLERGDSNTIRNHLKALDAEDRILYKEVSKEVLKLAKKKNKDRDYSEIESLLKGESL